MCFPLRVLSVVWWILKKGSSDMEQLQTCYQIGEARRDSAPRNQTLELTCEFCFEEPCVGPEGSSVTESCGSFLKPFLQAVSWHHVGARRGTGSEV